MVWQVDRQSDTTDERAMGEWAPEDESALTTAQDAGLDSGLDSGLDAALHVGTDVEEDEAQETLLLVPLLSSAHGQPARPQRVVLRPAHPRVTSGIWTHPLTLALFACLCLLLVAGALDGMQQYALIRAQTLDAVTHIHNAQALLASAPPGHSLDAATLRAIDADLAAADSDAMQLSSELGAPAGSVLVARVLPGLSSRIASAAAFASAADPACQAGRNLVAGALLVLQLRSEGFLDARGQLTHQGRKSTQAAALIQQLQADLVQASAHLDLASTRARGADLDVLPPSVATPAQRAGLAAFLGWESGFTSHLAAPDGWHVFAPAVLGGTPPVRLLMPN